MPKLFAKSKSGDQNKEKDVLTQKLKSIGRKFDAFLPQNIKESYELLLYSAGLDFTPAEFIFISLVLAVIFAIGALIIKPEYALWTFIIVFGGYAYLYPTFKVSKKISEIEKALPDFFTFMASSLNSGVSFTESLEEASRSNFGVLTKEIEQTVKEIRAGVPVADALKAFAIRNRKSKTVYRAFMILSETYSKGAPMAQVLTSLARDIRETLKIQRDRKAATGQQFMYFVATNAVVAPLVLAFAAKMGIGMIQSKGASPETIQAIKVTIQQYAAIQAIVGGLALGTIREGKLSTGLKYGILMAASAVLIATLVM